MALYAPLGQLHCQEDRMALMEDSKPLQLPLRWLPCGQSSLQFTLFTANRMISWKCLSSGIIPFHSTSQWLPTLLPMALFPPLTVLTLSSHCPPHYSSHRPAVPTSGPWHMLCPQPVYSSFTCAHRCSFTSPRSLLRCGNLSKRPPSPPCIS